MLKTSVSASVNYDILIEKGLLFRSGAYIKEVIPCGKALIVADSNTKIYLDRVKTSLEENGFSVFSHIVEAGEKSKSIKEFSNILEFAAKNNILRSDFFVALGGGVVGDLTGFASASYMRGTRYVQIPTTLLAAVDSSVGGKTAINLESGKNLAGAFHQPSLVLTDTDTFKTLDKEVFSDGIAESVKYGILFDRNLFDIFKEGIDGKIEEIIKRCTEIKSALVSKDEFDRGTRQFLNLGHTFGHAIEKLSGFKISHGSAVAIGMVIASRAAERLLISKENLTDEIISVLKNNGLPTACPYNAEEIFSAALTDKKRLGDFITLVLPEEIGKCVLKTVSIEEFKDITEKGVCE